MKPKSVLVTDGHLRSSLAVVRSLGRAGYSVFVCSPRNKSLAGASRFAIADRQVPAALAHPDAFAEAIAGLAREFDIAVLLPMSEEALLALLPLRNALAAVTVPFAPLEAFRSAADKEHVTRLAASMGIAVPEQAIVRRREELPSAVATLRFPVVVKPARTVSGDGADRVKVGVSYAANGAELGNILTSLPARAFPVLLQQQIEGPGMGVFLLIWDSRVVAQFAHLRIREKPPSGGVSVCAESIEADATTIEQSRSLLSALNWRGPAMVEFKRDRTSGHPYLMEINGRFWGSLQLAVDAGVDFPALLVASALGEKPQAVTRYTTGVRTRWWWGEVDHLIARLRGNSTGYGLGGRWGALRNFLAPGRGVRNEVLRADDPRPFVRESIDWFRRR